MAYYKLTNPTGNADDHLQVHLGTTGCCGDAAALSTYTSTATNLSTSAVEKVVIDGTEYTFTVAADTLAKLKAGVEEALALAGYRDLKGVGVSTAGAVTTAQVVVVTTATMTKLINAAAADIAFTAS